MLRTSSSLRCLLVAASFASLDIGGVARADDNDACLTAYEKSQQTRKEGKLAASREQLNLCVQPRCHDLIKRDCSRWTLELEKIMPTVLVTVRDAHGIDMPAVRVLVDGVLLQHRLDGKPHEVDPGAHLFRFDHDGAVLAEERIVVQEGEKNRAINITVKGADAIGTPAAKPQPKAPAGGYVLLGVGALGGAAFGVLAAAGQLDLDEMRKEPGGCAPHCDEGRVTEARTKIIAANVSLGVGLVAAGLGAYLLLKPRDAATDLRLGVRPVAGGASTDLVYRF